MDGVYHAIVDGPSALAGAFPAERSWEWRTLEADGSDDPRLSPNYGRRVLRYLHAVHGITPAHALARAAHWRHSYLGDALPEAANDGRPDPGINMVLSTLDLMLMEGTPVGRPARRPAPGPDRGRSAGTPVSGGGKLLNTRELDRVRERVLGAMALSFLQLRRRIVAGNPDGRLHVGELRRALRAGDAIVTTNWDSLADVALVDDAHATRADHGTDAFVVNDTGRGAAKRSAEGAVGLLKLHGGLNWLHCRRCTRLYVNPFSDIAVVPSFRNWRDTERGTCDCGMRLAPLLVAPSYVRAYGNRHLANVWSRAMDELRRADRWVIAGYSLPSEDVHVVALLLRTLQMRDPSELEIVLANPDPLVGTRMAALLQGRAALRTFPSLLAFLEAPSH